MTSNDFSLIKVDGLDMTPSKMKALNKEFRIACTDAMSSSNTRNKIVVSHFPQSIDLKHSAFPTDILTRYFCSDDNDLIQELAALGVQSMVSGHTHDNFDTAIEGVRQV